MKRLVLIATALVAVSCAHPKPDTSQLSAQGIRDYKATQVVKAVNDVSTAAITANKAKQLSDAHTIVILTIDKQVLDVIEANPVDFQSKAITVFRNARDALPADAQASIGAYLEKVAAILSEVK